MSRVGSLDGLRGLAAVLVLFHHAGDQIGGVEMFASGYLAVDFFFMLSGYVVARAYDRRLADDLMPSAFLALRLRRLYPVMAIGILAGAAIALMHGMAAGEVGWRLAAQLLFVPIIAGSIGIFPLNGVQWSLFFELFANFVHATWLRRLSGRTMAVLTMVSLGLLAWAAFDHRWFALGDTGSNFVGGFARVAFAYCLGVAMCRLSPIAGRWRPQVSSAVLLAAFPTLVMVADVAKAALAPWLVDLAVVTLALPVVLHLGIGARPEPRLEQPSGTLGAMSYPLYAVHLPALGLVPLLMPGPGPAALLLGCGIALAAAFLLARWLEPVPAGGRRVEPAGVPERLLAQ